MKKLHLEVSKSKELHKKEKYSIFFKRGYVMKFSSKRKAEDYLRLFRSNVNDLIRSTFTIHKKFYDLYLDHYFEIDQFFCNNIENKNSTFLQRLHYCFKEYSKGNQSIAIDSIFTLLNSVEDSINELKKWAKENNKHNLVNECNSMLFTHQFLNNRYIEMIEETKATKDYKIKSLKIAYKSSLQMTS